MAVHNDLGKYGEDLATKMLQKKGYVIKERNWSLNGFETDIIAMDGDTIVFVEVKTRTAGGAGRPEDAVDYERQKRLVVGGNAYVRYHKLDCPWRMDIVAIVVPMEGEPEINHIQDAFFPPQRTISQNSFSGSWRYKKKR